MNFLPKEIEDIIIDYQYQLEHTDKFIYILEELKQKFTIRTVFYENENNIEGMNMLTYTNITLRGHITEDNLNIYYTRQQVCCSKYIQRTYNYSLYFSSITNFTLGYGELW